MYFCPIIAICSVGLANVPAVADLTASITADTWVAAHTPTLNFNGGIQGSASIDGNDPGGWLRYVIEGSDFYARAAILQFQLPILPANQTITGVRLVLWDGEYNKSPDIDVQVGWLTGKFPMMSKITYMDLAPSDFGGGKNNDDALDLINRTIRFDPAKVQFAHNNDPSEDLMSMTLLASGTYQRPDPYVPYADLTIADGLANYVTDQIDATEPKTIHIILSPIASSNAHAMIHGIDASTPTSDIRMDILGTPSDFAFHPRLEIFTYSEQAPIVPEVQTGVLLAFIMEASMLRRNRISHKTRQTLDQKSQISKLNVL